MKVEVREDGTVHAWQGRTHLWIRRVQLRREGKVCAFNVSKGQPGKTGNFPLEWHQIATLWASKNEVNDLVLALMALVDNWDKAASKPSQ